MRVTRREFMKANAIATAATVAGISVPAERYDSSASLRLLIIV